MLKDSERIKNTEDFLKLIAYRLSGRDDTKHLNYRIKISKKSSVSMEPMVYIFPNRYCRKESDRTDVVSYILSMMMNDWDFVPGEYVYQSSINNKRRRWVKVK